MGDIIDLGRDGSWLLRRPVLDLIRRSVVKDQWVSACAFLSLLSRGAASRRQLALLGLRDGKPAGLALAALPASLLFPWPLVAYLYSEGGTLSTFNLRGAASGDF